MIWDERLAFLVFLKTHEQDYELTEKITKKNCMISFLMFFPLKNGIDAYLWKKYQYAF